MIHCSRRYEDASQWNDRAWRWYQSFHSRSSASSPQASKSSKRLHCSGSVSFFHQDEWCKYWTELDDHFSTSPPEGAAPQPLLELLQHEHASGSWPRLWSPKILHTSFSWRCLLSARSQCLHCNVAEKIVQSCIKQTSKTQLSSPGTRRRQTDSISSSVLLDPLERQKDHQGDGLGRLATHHWLIAALLLQPTCQWLVDDDVCRRESSFCLFYHFVHLRDIV